MIYERDLLSNPEQTHPLTIKVIKKLKRIKKESIFSSRCLGLKEPINDVNKVLRSLYCSDAIQLLTDHVYMKSDECPYDLTDEQLIEAVTLCEQVYGHKIQIHGAKACLKFGIPVDQLYAESFYTTDRTMNMRVIDREIFIHHCPIPNVFNHPIKIVCEALSALHHLGEDQATIEHIKLICDAMTDDEVDEFNDSDKPKWMEKLNW
ncbi:hypothetical protein NI470_05925 [Acinetobacter lwoffii]|uniref:hypothetical protein n=1 Tax=Acinetobacter lwoffii TaxID=28090 RepID=UPI00209A9572|nr:hypothetical protein [Acinetobacter lwoffii]MCO8073042.1 hypothetical protein [Acinetobacter lwoffii]MCO8076144.1 hypothetical protein [Acinetobacter lwoffii]